LTAPVAFANTPPRSLQPIGRRWGEHRLSGIGLGIEQTAIVGFRRPADPSGQPLFSGSEQAATYNGGRV
jgi:hypothetical protein